MVLSFWNVFNCLSDCITDSPVIQRQKYSSRNSASIWSLVVRLRREHSFSFCKKITFRDLTIQTKYESFSTNITATKITKFHEKRTLSTATLGWAVRYVVSEGISTTELCVKFVGTTILLSLCMAWHVVCHTNACACLANTYREFYVCVLWTLSEAIPSHFSQDKKEKFGRWNITLTDTHTHTHRRISINFMAWTSPNSLGPGRRVGGWMVWSLDTDRLLLLLFTVYCWALRATTKWHFRVECLFSVFVCLLVLVRNLFEV